MIEACFNDSISGGDKCCLNEHDTSECAKLKCI